MFRLSCLEEIDRLYAARGHLGYGEGVTQIEHALQCAALADLASAAPELTLAALLHDIGHLLADENDPALAGRDFRHEILGAQALEGLFGPAVCAPIALHVEAKRYLCFKEPDYLTRLSLASQASLALQGGPFDEREAVAFEGRPYWRDAVAIRRYDDAGKREGLPLRAPSELAPLIRALSSASPNC